MTHIPPAFPAQRAHALKRLQDFVPHSARTYAARRNYDLGAGAHSGVSQLSPYLRHRILTEDDVLRAVLARFALSSAEKFVQEVFWRTYWKGWLELRPGVWDSYRATRARDLDHMHVQSGQRQTWEDACLGRSGIDCFDHWARELVDTGYLHNHARMWFASIWIFTLRLPWALGADFFLRHLLDGDPASNTLSWRWVAGLQTRGKTYLARPDNIAKYTEGRFNPTGLARVAEPLPSEAPPAVRPLPEPRPLDKSLRTGLVLHPEDLSYGGPSDLSPVACAWLRAEDDLSPLLVAPHLGAFLDAATAEHSTRYADVPLADVTARDAAALLDWARAHRLEQIVTAYAPVGPTASVLEAVRAHLPVITQRRAYDSAAWPHATHGFFRFKDKIPTLLGQMNGLETV